MKQLPLIQVGNPLFRKPCAAYTTTEILQKDTAQLVKQMKYTLRQIHGVGLAAPQVGIQKQLFVLRLMPTKFRPNLPVLKPYAVFNPGILVVSKAKTTDYEGCFSVAHAGLFAQLQRPQQIKVQYINENAQLVIKELHDLEARIFLHEYDHLVGKVFLDAGPDPATFMSANEYQAMRAQQMGK